MRYKSPLKLLSYTNTHLTPTNFVRKIEISERTDKKNSSKTELYRAKNSNHLFNSMRNKFLHKNSEGKQGNSRPLRNKNSEP